MPTRLVLWGELFLSCVLLNKMGSQGNAIGNGGTTLFHSLLQPPPHSLSFGSESNLTVLPVCRLEVESSLSGLSSYLGNFAQLLFVEFGITVASDTAECSRGWGLKVACNSSLTKAESYNLSVGLNLVTIEGADESGLFYGLQTLLQLLRIGASIQKDSKALQIPQLTIHDFPSFHNRGVMLDVSRDKVYKVSTVKMIIETLAHFKYNQLQLYMEHTFAYAGHEEVWRDSSPFTPSDILDLCQYCKERFVELVPNQNSFGHMHRWLSHEKYKQLAEVPEGIMHGFNNKQEPYSICPTSPDAILFLKDLYSQLLPNFRGATQFNVGLDETFDLGKGQSRMECLEKGVENVYLDFLRKIHALLAADFPQFSMQFWGDIILHRPDLIHDLPKNIIALDWGYEFDHPFAESTKLFANSTVPFYVCPGTSSWNSIGGRVDNCYGNLLNAAENGHQNGAIGYLVTDWGDHGHWQQLPISFFGIVAGAGFSWNVKGSAAYSLTDGVKRIGTLLDIHLFQSEMGTVGLTMIELGNAYQSTKIHIGNQTVIFRMILFPGDHPTLTITQRPTTHHLQQTEKLLQEAKERFLSYGKTRRADNEILLEEIIFTFDLMMFACQFGIAYAQNIWEQDKDKVSVKELPSDTKRLLALQLDGLIDRFKICWLRRNNSGGLRESVGRLQHLRAMLE